MSNDIETLYYGRVIYETKEQMDHEDINRCLNEFAKSHNMTDDELFITVGLWMLVVKTK